MLTSMSGAVKRYFDFLQRIIGWMLIRLCLDLDGVVHPMVSYGHVDQHLCCLEALEAVMAVSLDSLEIVIVSSWRLTMTLDQIRSEIATGSIQIAERIVGATPKCRRIAGVIREPRWAEIATYALQYGNPPTVVIDDMDHYCTGAVAGLAVGRLGLMVFHPDTETGVTENDSTQIRKLFDRAVPMDLSDFHAQDWPVVAQ